MFLVSSPVVGRPPFRRTSIAVIFAGLLGSHMPYVNYREPTNTMVSVVEGRPALNSHSRGRAVASDTAKLIRGSC